MRTLKLIIAYDGTRYAGWQVQTGRSQISDIRDRKKKPTIQGTLERVLQQILQEPVKVVGSGRTDAGVHALAQAAHLRTHSTISCTRLLASVNALLPSDIAVTSLVEAEKTFHARFRASRKRYRYRAFTGSVVPPFIRPYVHHVRVPLDLAQMRREAMVLKGRHNFRAFTRATSAQRSTTRTITAVAIRRQVGELHFEFEGNGFLHTMVRSMVGTLIDVGRGRLPPGTIRQMLRTRDRRLTGTVAPARGLALVDVTYRTSSSAC